MRSLTLALAARADLQTLFDQDLSKGRAFVPGAAGVSEFEVCELSLEHAGRRHTLRAEVVFIKPDGLGRGVGLQLLPLDPVAKAELAAFVQSAAARGSIKPAPSERGEALTTHDRIRLLSPVDQQKLAASGTLPERIALERAFGPNVWEALLANTRLTIPEVATIARKGTVPRPLLESLAGHASWLAAPEVQRALLSNPRSTPAVVGKVLQSMARGDLALVARQTAYPHAVRAAAKKRLEGL
jgi:hypothetical protein